MSVHRGHDAIGYY